MDEFTAETFTNQEEPVPIIAVPDDDEDPPNSEEHKSKLRSAGSKLKGKFHDVVAGKKVTKGSLQDRVFTK